MNSKPKISNILFILIISLLTGSCEYKDFEDMEEIVTYKNISVMFDDSNINEIPASMTVAFFPKDKQLTNKNVYIFDVPYYNAEVKLPTNEYSVVTWNNNTEHIIINDIENYDSYASTGEFSPHGDATLSHVLDSIYNHQKIYDFPDYMVHGFRDDVVIGTDDKQVVTLPLDSMVTVVNLTIGGIENLSLCYNIRAALDNLEGTRYMGYDNRTSNNSVVMFDMKAIPNEKKITASFYVFGCKKDLSHKLTLFFWLNGGKVFIPKNITDYISYSGDKTISVDIPNLNIDLEKYIRKPEPGKDNQPGIKVDVDEWGEEEIRDISF